MSARVILDSIGPNDVRLTTFEVTLPRIVLAEFNTHRMLSRNSASSRALPFAKMAERVKSDPFIPKRWPKNQSGMQATEYLSEESSLMRVYEDGDEKQTSPAAEAASTWRNAARMMREYAKDLNDVGVHKAICNRLLEPFLWHTIVFTATELDNFFALRADKMAQDEIREPVEMLIEAYEKSTPMRLNSGEWHLPFVTNYDVDLRWDSEQGKWSQALIRDDAKETIIYLADFDWLYWAKISAARCARVSYLTHEGKRDLAEDEKLYERLVQPGHMSPLEHPAKAMTTREWEDYMVKACAQWTFNRIPIGNFFGWQQLRKTIEHEHNAKLLRAAT